MMDLSIRANGPVAFLPGDLKLSNFGYCDKKTEDG